MIVDASVWVAIFRENDVHHGASVAFLDLAVANQRDLNIPNLALAEIAGVFARQTGKARLATRTVRAEALDQPLITLDREILERSSRIIEAEAPDVWVHRQSGG
jgi:predicted nucleic acid-binding protein